MLTFNQHINQKQKISYKLKGKIEEAYRRRRRSIEEEEEEA